MYKFIPGLNELTSDSSVAKLRVSVLRPLNRYSRSLDRSTMYVPTVPQRPKLSPHCMRRERERKKEREICEWNARCLSYQGRDTGSRC